MQNHWKINIIANTTWQAFSYGKEKQNVSFKRKMKNQYCKHGLGLITYVTCHLSLISLESLDLKWNISSTRIN